MNYSLWRKHTHVRPGLFQKPHNGKWGEPCSTVCVFMCMCVWAHESFVLLSNYKFTSPFLPPSPALSSGNLCDWSFDGPIFATMCSLSLAEASSPKPYHCPLGVRKHVPVRRLSRCYLQLLRKPFRMISARDCAQVCHMSAWDDLLHPFRTLATIN